MSLGGARDTALCSTLFHEDLSNWCVLSELANVARHGFILCLSPVRNRTAVRSLDERVNSAQENISIRLPRPEELDGNLCPAVYLPAQSHHDAVGAPKLRSQYDQRCARLPAQTTPPQRNVLHNSGHCHPNPRALSPICT